MTLPTLTNLRNWCHSAAAIVGWLALVFGLAQTSLISLVGGNPKYAQWIAGIGAGLVLLSKAIDSANNALGGTPIVAAAPAAPSQPNV